MTAPFPKPCGRLDWHDPHEWIRHPHHEGVIDYAAYTPARTYSCAGRVLIEGGYWADWDAADDAAEHRMDREKRDIA